MKRLVIVGLALISAASGQQIYDLLLKNGQVIDPANHRNGRMDVAVIGNKIAKVAPNLPAAYGRIVMDVGAYAVTPGLIDASAYVNGAAQGRNLQPDHNCLPYGVTTVVDAGEAAAKDSGHDRLGCCLFTVFKMTKPRCCMERSSFPQRRLRSTRESRRRLSPPPSIARVSC